MATAKTFEDLDVGKNAILLTKEVFQLCTENGRIKVDFSYKDQLKRATLSISNNIAEGFEYNNNKQFYRFLAIAKGSCGEVRNCLLVAIATNYCTKEEVEKQIEATKHISSQINRLMKYLSENESKE